MDIKLLEVLSLTGTVDTYVEDGIVYLTIALHELPKASAPRAIRKLREGSIMALMFRTLYEMSQDGDPVDIQALYAKTLPGTAPPMQGVRDRRPERIRRALVTLHEKGYVTVAGTTVVIGRPDDYSDLIA